MNHGPISTTFSVHLLVPEKMLPVSVNRKSCTRSLPKLAILIAQKKQPDAMRIQRPYTLS